MVAKKPGVGKFRMTVDVKSVNAQTENLHWPMSIIEVILESLREARVFCGLDFFKGFWQLPLHPKSQGFYSFQTDRGVHTPTRVLMEGSDSVAFCQAAVQEIFEELLYNWALVWLDDVLGYASDDEELMAIWKGSCSYVTKKIKKIIQRSASFSKKKCADAAGLSAEKG